MVSSVFFQRTLFAEQQEKHPATHPESFSSGKGGRRNQEEQSA